MAYINSKQVTRSKKAIATQLKLLQSKKRELLKSNNLRLEVDVDTNAKYYQEYSVLYEQIEILGDLHNVFNQTKIA